MDGSSEGSAAGDGPKAEAGGAGSTADGGAPAGAFGARERADAAGRSEEDGETWRSLGEVLQDVLAKLETDAAAAPLVLTSLGWRTVPVLKRQLPTAVELAHAGLPPALRVRT